MDVVVLASDWQPRALIRAELIEQGFDVLATDTWPVMRRYLRPGIKPRLAFVDLKGLPDSEHVLAALRVLMKPDRVLVLTAMGTQSPTAVEQMGFRALRRPIAIEDVVRAIGDAVRFTGASHPHAAG